MTVAPPPLALDRFTSFAAAAELMLNERLARDPARIDAKELTKSEADHRRFTAGGIAEIWCCIRDPRRRPAPRYMGLTRHQALETLSAAIGAAEIRVRRRPDDRGRQHLLEQLRAMRWWHAYYPEPPAFDPDSFDPAPAGRVYALQMLLNVPFDALQLRARQPEAERPAA